ncbi:MAG: hypothetical protein Q8M92_02755, partial [Candidatus Subteraquimicrobiales bacterium]|nr:hypothetical protein [Candidatus Subteraquimicrobiales bacterium]
LCVIGLYPVKITSGQSVDTEGWFGCGAYIRGGVHTVIGTGVAAQTIFQQKHPKGSSRSSPGLPVIRAVTVDAVAGNFG